MVATALMRDQSAPGIMDCKQALKGASSRWRRDMMTPLPEPGVLGIEGHSQVSRRFLEQAKIHLAEGDRLQAAEKVWGAAAHALKAVGEQRGWVHNRHPNIFDIGEHLGREFGQERQFHRYLAQAQYMHVDFYTNGWSEDAIQSALSDVEEFVDELDIIINSPPRTYTVINDSDRIRLGRLLGLRRPDRPPIGDYSPVGYSRTHQA